MPKKKVDKTKTLKKELAEARADANKFHDLYYDERSKVSELREKIEKHDREDIMECNHRVGMARYEIERLTDIIRWLIKPTTAELTEKERELLRRGY